MKALENLAEPDKQPETRKTEVEFAPDQVVDNSKSAIVDDRDAVYPRVQRPAMGSLFEIYLAGRDRDLLETAGNAALDEVERLERQLSHYLAESDIARLNAQATEHWVRLEPRLYELIKECVRVSEETEGAFDITSAPLVKAWGFHDGNHRVPTDDEIATLLGSVGSRHLNLDDDDCLVNFGVHGMELTLGAVGKGYAIDEAARTLTFYGVRSALLHGGQSTIYALGAAPDDNGWSFDIKDPIDKETIVEKVLLRDEALSTSGNYEQYFEHDGTRYTHIIDPLTGIPVEGIVSVSVICKSAMMSDALSTAFFVLGLEKTREYCAKHEGIRVIMIEVSDNVTTVTRIGFD